MYALNTIFASLLLVAGINAAAVFPRQSGTCGEGQKLTCCAGDASSETIFPSIECIEVPVAGGALAPCEQGNSAACCDADQHGFFVINGACNSIV